MWKTSNIIEATFVILLVSVVIRHSGNVSQILGSFGQVWLGSINALNK